MMNKLEQKYLLSFEENKRITVVDLCVNIIFLIITFNGLMKTNIHELKPEIKLGFPVLYYLVPLFNC